MPSKRHNTSNGRESEPSEFVLLSGRSNPNLAREIAKALKKDIDEPITMFSDGEIRVRIRHNLRRRQVYIIQPTSAPVNDHIMELMLLIDAAKRASAKEIVAVIPYFGYARQDRKEMSRVPISASLVANMIEQAGASRILTVDIHSEQQEGFIRGPWDDVYGSYALIPALKKKKFSHLVVASPDKGGMKRATGYAKLMDAEGVAIVYKERDVAFNNKSEALYMIGNVQGRDVLLVDDMIDTGGTIVNAANYLKKRGAKRIIASSTHGLFSGKALENIEKSAIEEVLITDTITQREEVARHPKVKIVSVASLLAEAIRRIHTGESLSDALFLM